MKWTFLAKLLNVVKFDTTPHGVFVAEEKMDQLDGLASDADTLRTQLQEKETALQAANDAKTTAEASLATALTAKQNAESALATAQTTLTEKETKIVALKTKLLGHGVDEKEVAALGEGGHDAPTSKYAWSKEKLG